MVWKKDAHAYTWNDLDGQVAPEILCIPRTGSDPTGTWPKVHARVLGYVMRNVRGKPWIDHLALIAAVMTAQRRDVGTVEGTIKMLHQRFSSLLGRLHRLTIDDGRAGSRLAPLFLAHPFAQGGVHALPDPGVAPGAEVAPHRGPRRKLMRQGSPLASRAVQVQNGIDHFTHLGGSGVSPWLGRGDQLSP